MIAIYISRFFKEICSESESLSSSPLNKDFNMQYYQYFNSTSFSDNSMPKPSKDMTGKSVRRQAFRIKLAKLWGHIF